MAVKNSKTLVTLLIGDDLRAFWNRHIKATWERCAEKHGYDVVIIDDYIDQSPRAREKRH